ncbi:hypothetical protein HDU82_005228 [Entophlyctis luteolus]|nr:hypothetical protein HDU82_005228 [Entophlyctis luteolus]
MTPTIARVLTIAGSDSGGGAGIQADLKTFTAMATFGTSVITALTAQNTVGVQAVHAVPAAFVAEQLDSVLEDIGTDAAKTGMLFDRDTVRVVAEKISKYNVRKYVLDPVMIATSGDRLLAENAVQAIMDLLVPLALLVTPNIPEAEVMCAHVDQKWEGKIGSLEDMHQAADILRRAGVENLLIKGGHLPVTLINNVEGVRKVFLKPEFNSAESKNEETKKYCVDLLYAGDDIIEFWKPFIDTKNTHGTGCTLSAAIASCLAVGKPLIQSVEEGLLYIANALRNSPSIGSGRGPLNHVFAIINARSPIADKDTFIHKLKASCQKEWNAYVHHPFVEMLGDGTLPEECFKHYIRQDYIYLLHYARAYALAAYKSNNFSDIVEGSRAALNIAQESQVHIKYCETWGISKEELENTKEALANLSYSRFFLEKGVGGDRLDLMVALAPCLLGYGEVGLALANNPKTKKEGNLYWEWIANYAKEDFQRAVRDGEGNYARNQILGK